MISALTTTIPDTFVSGLTGLGELQVVLLHTIAKSDEQLGLQVLPE